MAKLDIGRELSAVDRRNFDFYDKLSADEQKEFSPFVLMRYISDAEADYEYRELYLERCNEFVNKDHWVLSKNHKALLWKLCAAVGLGVSLRHTYLKAPSKLKAEKFEKLLAEQHPAMKMSEIKLWASLMTKEEKKEYFDNLGYDKKPVSYTHLRAHETG
jgi:hypothetical protein